jgi:hypothetical protein
MKGYAYWERVAILEESGMSTHEAMTLAEEMYRGRCDHCGARYETGMGGAEGREVAEANADAMPGLSEANDVQEMP